MTTDQLEAATKIRAAISHYAGLLDFEESLENPTSPEWPYDDEEYIRLEKAADDRLKTLYRQRIAELEKQFSEL